MKKFLLIAAALCCSIITFAQNKGDMYISATLDFGTGTQKVSITNGSLTECIQTPLSTTFGLGAEYGYFVADCFRLSLAMGYSLSSNPSKNINEKWHSQTVNLFSVNPNIAYYVKLAEKFYYTPEIGYSFYFGSQVDPETSTSTYKTPATSWAVYANIISFELRISKLFAMGMNYGYLGYESAKYSAPDYSDYELKLRQFKVNIGTAGLYARFYL